MLHDILHCPPAALDIVRVLAESVDELPLMTDAPMEDSRDELIQTHIGTELISDNHVILASGSYDPGDNQNLLSALVLG